MTLRTPTVSVVITTHNRHREARRAVESAVSQTLAALEIIVVDDGSNPPLSVADLPTEYPTAVRLVRRERAIGPSGARNAGIRAASGAWVAFLDDDDQYLPDKLMRCMHAICERPDVSVLHHSAHIDMVNESVEYTTRLEPHDGGPGLYRRLLVKNIVGGTPMVLVRREALEAVGGFDESLRALEDYELWLRLARDGYRFLALPEPLTRCDYVTARKSVTKSDAAGAATFDKILSLHASTAGALTIPERLEHGQWVHEIEVHRAMLRLDRHDTLLCAWALWRFRPTWRATAALVAAAVLGPRAMIRLRSRR